jgi:GAF domain-containing protein
MYVPDVSVFPGYICCDTSAKSEYVCPLYQDGSLVGVFDVDSPELDGLKGKEDYLKECADLLSALPFPSVE